MTVRPKLRWALAAALLAAACATAGTPRPKGQELYFELEVAEAGKVIAHPRFLGEAGRRLRAERRPTGSTDPDYQLVLQPQAAGSGYRIQLDLATPRGAGHSDLALGHGEARKVELGPHPGDLEVSLLVMRVDSPEFRALMDLGSAPRELPSSI